MLSALFTSVADALISYAIDKLDPAERIKSWLRLDPARLAFKKALARAYSAFARQYPEYTSSLFDQSFLSTDALPELSKLLTRNQHPDPALLAQAWGRSLGANTDFAQVATKPAAYFLELFEAELKAEPALQSIFDSRALENLPNLESEIQKLSTDLQRGLDEALKAATDYQKVTLHITGDVKDSNIIIGDNNVINKFYYSGDFVSLNEYYIPPDGVFQRVRVDDFIGRDWLTTKVDAFLNDPNRKSGAFLLIGDAGVGKTSFMAHLVKERRYLHLFAEQVPGQAMVTRALQSLESQLITRYQIDPYHDRDTLNVLADSPDFLERILRYAAEKLAVGEKIVIVCDALDEAGVGKNEFVFGLPKELPDGVYFILSQRPVNVKLPNFEPVIEKLEAQGEGNLHDMQDYLSAVAKQPEVVGQIRSKEYSEEFFIQTLQEKSQGVWMYLHYIIKEIESGARAPLDLANLPTGLVGYYAEYWDAWRTGKRGKGEEAWDELYAPLLTTLAAAQEAIPVDWLIRWADITAKPREVTRLLTEHWRAFITEKEVDGKKTYTTYHLSFKDFITGRVETDKLVPAQANLVKDLAAQAVDAHKRIVSVFEKECNGEWEKLVEQEYPRLHLSAHLNGAGDYVRLQTLLTEGGEKIKWAEAREKKEETYAGYLKDLTYIWDYAEREQDYALTIRCMLIENSIHSLAGNIPPELLVELGKTGIWSYSRCLTVIRQNPQITRKIKAIELFAPLIPLSLYEEFLTIALEINDEKKRVKAIEIIISYTPQNLLSLIANSAYKMKDKYFRFLTIKHVWNYSKDIQSEVVLSYAREIENTYNRSVSLWSLATELEESQKEELIIEALDSARQIDDVFLRASMLGLIIPNLPSDLQSLVAEEGFDTAIKIEEESLRGYTLAHLSPYLPEDLFNQVVSEIKTIKNIRDRAKALIALATNCTNEKIRQTLADDALDTVSNMELYLDDTLKSLIPILNKEQVLQSIVLSENIKYQTTQSLVLKSALYRIKKDLHGDFFMQILSTIRQIKSDYVRSRGLLALLGIAPDNLASQITNETLSAARNEKDGYYRFRALEAIKLSFPDNPRMQIDEQEFLSALQNAKENMHYMTARVDFASSLPEASKKGYLLETLSETQKLGGEEIAINALSILISYFSDKEKKIYSSNLLKSLDQFSETNLPPILLLLIPHVSQEVQRHILGVAKKIKQDEVRVRTLLKIALYFEDDVKVEIIEESLRVVNKLTNMQSRAELLSEIVLIAPSDVRFLGLEGLLNILYASEEEVFYSLDLGKLLSLFPEQFQKKIIASIHKVKLKKNQERILTHLFSQASDTLRFQIIELIKDSQEQSISLDFLDHIFALKLIDLSPDIAKEFLFFAKKQKTDGIKFSRVIKRLIPFLPIDARQEILLETLDIARKIRDEYGKSVALSSLLPFLSDDIKILVTQEALKIARCVDDASFYGDALLQLSKHVHGDLRITIYYEIFQLGLDFELRINRPLPEMLQQWSQIDFAGFEEKYIFTYLKNFSKKDLHQGASAFFAITPALVHFRGPGIADELYRTITDVTRWWP